ncbi:hypothetical protein V7149_16655, partial [Bacillus sp. JJ1503]|uniref:hypothetical protein n=1 Tax=Bacillus sp. JJ1503 TaxID=3122956 RepID=UPI002FFEF658
RGHKPIIQEGKEHPSRLLDLCLSGLDTKESFCEYSSQEQLSFDCSEGASAFLCTILCGTSGVMTKNTNLTGAPTCK